jgi:hypothetical protein
MKACGFLLFLLFLAMPALASAADDAEVKRALMQRDQMSQEFALGLQQNQLRARVPSGDADAQQRMEQLFSQQRQEIDRLHQQQLLDMQVRGRANDPVQPEYDAQRFERDRQAAGQQFRREQQALERERVARQRALAPERHTPTLEPPPPRWGPSL